MNNKVIVITGGATGMGLAIGKQLMENNTVVSIDRNLSNRKAERRIPKDCQHPWKMSPEEFAKAFLKKLSNGNSVINVGQSASLEIFSRFFPTLAFRLLNRALS